MQNSSPAVDCAPASQADQIASLQCGYPDPQSGRILKRAGQLRGGQISAAAGRETRTPLKKPSHPNASLLLLAVVSFILSGPSPAVARLDPPNRPKLAKSKTAFEQEFLPFVGKYCYGCHGEKKKGDLDLRIYQDPESVARDKQVFEKVLKNLQAHEMPPEKKPQPTPEERERITAWIQSEIFQCDNRHPDPGRVTLRRLNRAEYNNTIRDLVGVDFHPADDFPADDIGYGFDNIGDVLSMPPMLIEKYMAAAEKILETAIVTDFTPKPPITRFE